MNLQKMTYTALAAACLAFSGAGMAQPAATTAAPMKNDATSKLARSDRNFLENAAQAGHAEIEASKLAETKAKSPDVKAFAAQMIKDHTEVGDALSKLASEKGYTPPSTPSVVQQAKIKTLSALSGHAFDKMYASQIGVSAHKDAVKLFKDSASKAKDSDIKAFAAKNAPALEEHLKMAVALKKKVDSGK